MKRLLLISVSVVAALVAIGLFLPLLPGPPLVERLPRASVVYSRPLTLLPGNRVPASAVKSHLERAQYRAISKGDVETGDFKLAKRSWKIGLRSFRYPDGNETGGLMSVSLDAEGRIDRIETSDGSVKDSLILEPVALALPGSEARAERALLLLNTLPDHVIDAVLVAEDRRFFVHPGVDPVRVAGAALENWRERRIVEGASTLTQQLAKNVYLTSERTWTRKLWEAGISFWLEFRYSKREILEAYLNEIYLGQDGSRAIHGVGPASRFWFGKDAAQLTIEEAALLAGMVRAPSALAPDKHPEKARKRRDQVLAGLLAHGRISEAEHAKAKATGVRVQRRSASQAFAPGFASNVATTLQRDYGEDALGEAGLRVFTTLDPHLQGVGQQAVRTELARLEKGYPLLRRKKSPLQAALVAIDPHTGEVLAWVGGRERVRGGFDRVTNAKRQPGSVFKPIVALAALTDRDRPRPFTLATVLEDEALEVDVDGEVWSPANYDGKHRGPVTLREALEESLNIPFARLGMEVGLVEVADTARRLGIESPLRPIPSLSLGSFEVSPLEITSAYGVLPAQGTLYAPRSILTLEEGGRQRRAPKTRSHAVFSPGPVHLVTEALQGAVDRGTGASLRKLGVKFPVAGKTGTTNGFRDAWFLAYTPHLVVGVWVGFDDGKRVGLTGAKAALPIVARFLKNALGVTGADFPVPGSIERVDIDPHTGLRAAEHCPGRKESFLVGTAPKRICPRDRWTPERWLERIFGR